MAFHRERFLQFVAAALLFCTSVGQSSNVAALQTSLKSQQTEWVLGVPVEFIVSVANLSNAPIKMYWPLSPLWDGISFFISEDGVNFHTFEGPEWTLGTRVDIMPGTITLKPDTKVQASFSLLWNGPDRANGQAPTGSFAFPHVGTYFVKVRASSHFGDLISNVIRVAILQPRGDDAAIWKALQADKELARFYEFPNGDSVQGEKLQHLLNMYPNSSHSTSMKKALSTYACRKAESERIKVRNAQEQR